MSSEGSSSSSKPNPVKPLEADQLKRMFAASQEREGSETASFSAEEKQRFTKAFDDPEFRRLFADYMDELQDPANRAETETYIAQLEGEGKVPQGKELIRPTAAFVVKTFKVSQPENTRNTAPEGKSGTEGKEKVFVNIVQSEKISPPVKTPSDKGVTWSVPYSVGPVHMEVDKAGAQNVPSFDCCFHPEAVEIGQRSKQFKDLLVQTAMDGVEAGYERQRLTTKLDRKNYHILKGITYKSGPQIPTMMIDAVNKEQQWSAAATGSKAATSAAPPVAPQSSKSGNTAPPQPPVPAAEKEAKPASKKGTAAPAIKKGFLDKAIKKESAVPTIKSKKGKTSSSDILLPGRAPEEDLFDTKVVEQSVDPNRPPMVQELGQNDENGSSMSSSEGTTTTRKETKSEIPGMKVASSVMKKRNVSDPATDKVPEERMVDNTDMDSRIPKYTVSEKGNQSMVTQEFESVGKQFVTSNRPVELVYRIELPKVVKSSQVELDVQERRLLLSYKDVYRLDVDPLPFPVFEQKGNAKYDKARKMLTVTLPVKPAPVIRAVGGSAASVSDEGVTNTTAQAEARSPSAQSKSPAAVASPPKKKSGSAHAKWVSASSTSPTGAQDSSPVVEELEGEPKLSLSEEIRRGSEAAVREYKEKQRAAAAASSGGGGKSTTAVTGATGTSKVPVAAKTVTTTSSAPTPTPSSGSSSGSRDFYPSKTFAGKKEGYVFKRDEKLGVGYHRDVQPQKQTPSEATTPVPSESVSSTAGVASPVAAADNYYTPFSYDYRQHSHCISVVINVPKITPDSVKIHYLGSDVTVQFTAVGVDERTLKDAHCDYGLQFHLPAAVVAEKCKYDVANMNMVLILTKDANAWNNQPSMLGSGGLTPQEVGALSEGKVAGKKDTLQCELLPVNATSSTNFAAATSNHSQSTLESNETTGETSVTEAKEPEVAAVDIPPAPTKAATPGNTAATTEMVEKSISELTFSSNEMMFELD